MRLFIFYVLYKPFYCPRSHLKTTTIQPPPTTKTKNVCDIVVFKTPNDLDENKCTACSEKSGNSANSSRFGVSGGGGGEYSSLSTLSEDFPAELIHELEAAAAANGNDQLKLMRARRRKKGSGIGQSTDFCSSLLKTSSPGVFDVVV